MPFTIGEIPIGNVLDGELVLRDVTIDYGGNGFVPLPSSPSRGRELPVLPPPPANIQPTPQLPGGVRPPDYRTEAPKPPVTPPPSLPTPIAMPPVPDAPLDTRPMSQRDCPPLHLFDSRLRTCKKPSQSDFLQWSVPTAGGGTTMSSPSMPAPTPAPMPAPVPVYEPPDASANTIKSMRDNLAKYNDYRARALAAATRNEEFPAATREDAIKRCQLFQSVANTGESYYEAMIRNQMVPTSQLLREKLPTTPPARLPNDFCENAAASRFNTYIPPEAGENIDEETGAEDVGGAAGSEGNTPGATIECPISNILEAANILKRENMWVELSAQPTSGSGGGTPSGVSASQATRREDILTILQRDTSSYAMSEFLENSMAALANAVSSPGQVDLTAAYDALQEIKKGLAVVPQRPYQVNNNIMSLSDGLHFVASQYAIKAMRQALDLIGECFGDEGGEGAAAGAGNGAGVGNGAGWGGQGIGNFNYGGVSGANIGTPGL